MNLLNSKQFSPIKDTIYTLIDKIITYEDQIKAIETNPLYLASVADLSKNKESILLLKQFISNESLISSKNCNRKESELNSLKSQLDLLQMSLEKETAVYTQRDLDQELIKQKCFEKTIELYNYELLSNTESIGLLKEEKLTIAYDIVNQMSLKESYEELIKANSQLMFKNLIISHDDNYNYNSTANVLSLNKPITVDHYEMNYASISKVVSTVHDTLIEYISSLQSFDKSILVSIISGAYSKYIADQESYDFFSNVTDDLINSNPKFNDFIIPDTFKKLLMYSVKSSALDKIISNQIKFINSEYKPRKMELIKAVNTTKEKIEKVRYKCNEAAIEVDKRKVYLNSIRAKNTLIKDISELEKEIEIINKETKRNVSNYEKQIRDLEKINHLLEEKYSSEKNKMKVEQLRRNIDEVFYQIKNEIKKSSNSNEVLNRFINDLNHTTKRKVGGKGKMKEIRDNRQINEERIEENDLILLSDDDFNIEEVNNEVQTIRVNDNNENEGNEVNDNDETSLEFSHTIGVINTKSNMPTLHNDNTENCNSNGNRYKNTKQYLTYPQATLLNESNIQTPPKPMTIQPSPKKTIETTESIPISNSKISHLYTVTECYSYLQDINDDSNQFNPLTIDDITPIELGYVKSEICLSIDCLHLNIKLVNRELKKISLSLLDRTIVTGSMKKVLTIVQLASHTKDIEELLQSPQIKGLNLTNEEIIHCACNDHNNQQYYHITIILTIAKKINLLFLQYNTFKQWVNGLAYIIKNKDDMFNS